MRQQLRGYWWPRGSKPTGWPQLVPWLPGAVNFSVVSQPQSGCKTGSCGNTARQPRGDLIAGTIDFYLCWHDSALDPPAARKEMAPRKPRKALATWPCRPSPAARAVHLSPNALLHCHALRGQSTLKAFARRQPVLPPGALRQAARMALSEGFCARLLGSRQDAAATGSESVIGCSPAA